MRNRVLILSLVCLFAMVMVHAVTPTMMRIVDLRGLNGQPELETWLGSLQGLLNRQDDGTLIFMVRSDNDEELASSMVAMYHLQREVLTPGALLDIARPSLTGQVRYDPAQPWTRNIALTAASVADGRVIASADDLNLPTVLDLRNRWKDRVTAYKWAVDNYSTKSNKQLLVIAPESGHLLADFISSAQCLAVDLAPTDPTEASILKTLIQHLPADGRVLGYPDDRCGDASNALWQLTGLLGSGTQTIIPVRDTVNLSCYSRFPITRPLLQGRFEADAGGAEKGLLLVYDGGSATLGGSQSLDYATNVLPELLNAPGLRNFPVGIEIPLTVREYAPALYQLLLARQRGTLSEFVAAPNGAAWALPMQMFSNTDFLQHSRALSKDMDVSTISLVDNSDAATLNKLLTGLSASGWQGALLHPIAAASLPDKHARDSQMLPNFAGLVGMARVKTISELRAAVTQATTPFKVIFLDPFALPPSIISALLPEITAKHTLLTPAQAYRILAEYVAVMPWMQAKQAQGIRNPKRDEPTIKVTAPTTTLINPTASDAIPIFVRISGLTPVLTARLVYQCTNGQIGAADLLSQGDGTWSATLPPTRTGGTLSIRARVVETGGYGISTSNELVLNIPVVDSDKDGLDDTLEEYIGTDPHNPDTDGDGLDDANDPSPTHFEHITSALLQPIIPPADTLALVSAGKSTIDAGTRLLPAGDTLSYHLLLNDVPKVSATLRLVVSGPGKATINDGTAIALTAIGDSPVINDLPLTAQVMNGTDITVKITAGDTPLRVYSLRILNNIKGPYILLPQLVPPHPPANEAIWVSAVVYSPNNLASVRLRYGPDTAHLQTLELKRVEGASPNVFVEQIPAQSDGSILIYAIEAEDVLGNISASPFSNEQVGHPRKHSIALIGTRDLQGQWLPQPIWNGYGRISLQGQDEDNGLFISRPGAPYHIWALLQPRERGIHLHVVASGIATQNVILDKIIPAQNPDGWYDLGIISAPDANNMKVRISPEGDKGFCAYGMVVFTQDERFTPPLAHDGIEWFNTIRLTGVENGQKVSGILVVNAVSTGNIDGITVTAVQRVPTAGVLSTDTYKFTKQRDGSYAIDTKQLYPGEYDITANGVKILVAKKQQQVVPVISVTVRVTIPVR